MPEPRLTVNTLHRPDGTVAERHYYHAGALSWKEYYHPDGTAVAKAEFYRHENQTVTLQIFRRPDGTKTMQCTYFYTGEPRQILVYDRNDILRKALSF